MTITNNGYRDIRTYMKNNWNWIGLVDDNGTVQRRYDILNSSSVTIINSETSNPLTVEIEVTGSDIENIGGSLPVTLQSTKFFKTNNSTTSMGSDSIADVELATSGDTVVVTAEYQSPIIN